MTEQEKSQKVLDAEEAVRQAKARLSRVKKEEREKLKKEQDHHKFMMGGIVAKYFPEGYSAYEFTELELNRMIACAFSRRDVKNMINMVVSDRARANQKTESNNEEKEGDENEAFDSEENEGGEGDA